MDAGVEVFSWGEQVNQYSLDNRDPLDPLPLDPQQILQCTEYKLYSPVYRIQTLLSSGQNTNHSLGNI